MMSKQSKAQASSNRTRKAGMRSRDSYKFYILFLLYGFCTLFYYFGELVDFAGWEALRWDFFYSVHDIHRLSFLAPIIYAGYVFGVKATVIITILTAGTFLPRALFISHFPDPILRAMLYILFAGAMGYLTAVARVQSRRGRHLETMMRSEIDKLSTVLEGIDEGVLTIGPDYRIRFMSPSMIEDFGEGVGSYCYEHLHELDAPCEQICELPNVINGEVERWEHNFPDGRTYEVLASPYIDSDEVVCQLAIFRNITQRKKVKSKLSNSTD